MSQVKSLAREISALPVEEAQAKVAEFLEGLIQACVQGVGKKDVNQPRELNEAAFRIRAEGERWKSLAHRLSAVPGLEGEVQMSRFEQAIRQSAAIAARVAEAAFAAPKSPQQLKAEAEAKAAAERAAKQKKNKARAKGKAKAPHKVTKPTPTVVVKPHRAGATPAG